VRRATGVAERQQGRSMARSMDNESDLPLDDDPELATRRALLERAVHAVARARALTLRLESMRAAAERIGARNAEIRGAARVRRRTRAPRVDEPQLRATLRDAAGEYARELRRVQMSPHTMLLLVRSAADAQRYAPLAAADADRIMADVVRWAIDAYYVLD
jgi:malonyl CoA-acyl carrier protein transacylase